MKAMTFQEFAQVVNHTKEHNSPFSPNYSLPCIKYIDPHFDMRTNTVFSIQFRTFGGGTVEFHCGNECRDLTESLFERIMAWLNTEKEA